MMAQVTKTAREISKQNDEQKSKDTASSESDSEDDIIGPLPPPNLGTAKLNFENYAIY